MLPASQGNLRRPPGESSATNLDSHGGSTQFASDRVAALSQAFLDIHRSFWLMDGRGGERFEVIEGDTRPTSGFSNRASAYIPAIPIQFLGDASFREDHGLDYAVVAGSMANGIASAELVEAMSLGGMLGFYGAAGQDPVTVERVVDRLKASLGGRPFGFNLIHSPQEAALESRIVDIYLHRGVTLIEASAFLDLTLPLVRYHAKGIVREPSGRVWSQNRIIGKVSRVEVAAKFMSPAPAAMLRELVHRCDITAEQAELASQIPVAQDVTAEADSGGHTDNRPAISLLPTFAALRDRLQRQHDFARPVRIGAAGGIATPASVAAALALGAAYIVTGSVNQACVESGSSDAVRAMLADAEQADTMMAPAADMFEMGVKLQVLKRGTMFPMRASKLYEIYRAYNSLEEIPAAERASLEKTIFRATLDEIWTKTRTFFDERDPSQVDRAERDPKHKMALVFRWYLGLSSRWANAGDASRRLDYQVWSGPAMGAFNEWVKGSFLERPENRKAVTVSLNLLYGASVSMRAGIARAQGIRLPAGFPIVAPLELAEVSARVNR
jgi:PfaD family protein